MTKAQIIDKYIQRIMVDYPEADKIHIDLVQFAEELRQCDVSGALPLPTKADASTYANGAFGYDADSYDKESAFMSGYQWTIDWVCSKTGGNDR